MTTSAIVAYDWDGGEPDMVSAKKGQALTVLENYGDGWCQVSDGVNSGIFPTEYLSFGTAGAPIVKDVVAAEKSATECPKRCHVRKTLSGSRELHDAINES